MNKLNIIELIKLLRKSFDSRYGKILDTTIPTEDEINTELGVCDDLVLLEN